MNCVAVSVGVAAVGLGSVMMMCSDPVHADAQPPWAGDAKMKAVQIVAAGTPEVTEVAVPKPGPGEVLIRVMASSINPSDTGFVFGQYSMPGEDARRFPSGAGFEGSGVVVASGGGVVGWMYTKSATRVAFSCKKGGAWAQYAVAKQLEVVPLPSDATFEQGAAAIVNPMTAVALLQTAQEEQHTGIVQTAAGSALGQMIHRLAPEYGITVVNVVRSSKGAQDLRNGGTTRVLSQDSPTFEDDLRKQIKEAGATMAIDAVGGSVTGQLFAILPEGSTTVVYGALSGEPPSGLAGIISEGKTLRGLHLARWLRDGGLTRTLRTIMKVRGSITGPLRTEFASPIPLSDAIERAREYEKNKSGKKLVIRPWA